MFVNFRTLVSKISHRAVWGMGAINRVDSSEVFRTISAKALSGMKFFFL